MRWDLATLRAFISSYRVGEEKAGEDAILDLFLCNKLLHLTEYKSSLVLPLIVNENNCCGVTVVTQLCATLMELITWFPCKTPRLACARITVASSLRSKKNPYAWADAQSLPHPTFTPVSIKKLEANCLTCELQSLHQRVFESQLGEMPGVCPGPYPHYPVTQGGFW